MQVLGLLDWLIIAVVLVGIVLTGLYLARRGSENVESYFISGRSLPWYIAGTSMLATEFASDTPLWITNLVRQYGIHYVWQYWAILIGAVLAAVYFGRLWRRLSIVTDVEMLEVRYSGRMAGVLRGWSGALMVAFACPLFSAWVTKAMVITSQQTMGLPPEYSLVLTAIVIAAAILLCTLSGLFGVVYTDFFLFFIATIGTVVFAWMSVNAVGGLDAMVTQLQGMEQWQGNSLSILPSIGSGFGQMSVWNAIGYFCILWIVLANSGGARAQRLLACRDTEQASLSMLMFAIIYYGALAWPWIIVALCSLILLPDLGVADQAAAYPQMIVTVLPAGLRGLLVAALMAAFVSTMSTIFNWGSSYVVNDIYKRFVRPQASPRSLLMVARAATVLIGVFGAVISFWAEDIQQLLSIHFVVASAGVVIIALRWLWWRMNAAGELAGVITMWALSALLLFGKVFDGAATAALGLAPGVEFSADPNLLGARMVFVTGTVTLVSVLVALCTAPTDMGLLRQFAHKARPFALFWQPVIRTMTGDYQEIESIGRTLLSWVIGLVAVVSLLFGIGELLLGDAGMGIVWMAIFCVATWWSVRRIREDFIKEQACL
ncbi:MAG: Na+:solute symporter [Gammaproteobacteria bacterium]|nr:Na+:solute symporter [Gammaproteobacteria bacterium]